MAPLLPSGTVASTEVTWFAGKLTFEVPGRDDPAGYTVRKPDAVALASVMLTTAATAPAAMPARPTTGTTRVRPPPITPAPEPRPSTVDASGRASDRKGTR